MERATLGDSNCPCQEDYGQGHCWCYAVISHDPVLSMLEALYYENPFKVVPIDGKYFIENVIVTCFEQTPIKFTQLEITKSKLPPMLHSLSTVVQKFHTIIQLEDTTITNPMLRKDQPRSLKALLTTTLLKVFPCVEDIHENFSLNQDEPLGIAKYVYYITTYHNAKPPIHRE